MWEEGEEQLLLATHQFYLRIFPQRVSEKKDNNAFPELSGGDYLLSSNLNHCRELFVNLSLSTNRKGKNTPISSHI